jgi:hypothetical protein
MLRRTVAIVVCGLGVFLGCEQSSAPPPSAPPPAPPANTDGGIHVTAPGVNVHIDPQRGVDVQAPGVDVKIKPDDNP